ncbi:hypothetical protein EDD38_0965 [Kitasatospora cineracea]|uniref:Uncharacterized protein n=1 Tax=Kitasatospora cineracea TaxID=88074 RepID=A0A3N4RH10_9ACTN|nr:hypothetical protein EDD38_0965 [Kitasatospora cineracea]
MTSVKGSKSGCTSRYQRLTRPCWTGPTPGGNGTYRDTSPPRRRSGWSGTAYLCGHVKGGFGPGRRPGAGRGRAGRRPPCPSPRARARGAPAREAPPRGPAGPGPGRKRRSFPAEWRGPNTGPRPPPDFPVAAAKNRPAITAGSSADFPGPAAGPPRAPVFCPLPAGAAPAPGAAHPSVGAPSRAARRRSGPRRPARGGADPVRRGTRAYSTDGGPPRPSARRPRRPGPGPPVPRPVGETPAAGARKSGGRGFPELRLIHSSHPGSP